MISRSEQIKAQLLVPTLSGHGDLTPSEQTFVCISEILYDAAEKTGGFENWTLTWLRYCEATGRDPLGDPGKITAYADIDRYCGLRLGEHEKDMELQAFIKMQQEDKAA